MSSDWERERNSLRDGVAARTVSLEMLEETYQQVLALAREHGWAEGEALLITFANGPAFLRGQQQLARLERSDLAGQVIEELDKTTRQLLRESARYASLKFKAFRMSQDNEALEMHESALVAETTMLKNRLERFREDEERLNARLEELLAENEKLRRRLETPASSDGAARARRTPAPVVSGAAWKVERPPARPEDAAGPHTWAENLRPTLPYRFQKYVEELLFDDERILYFVQRPAFRPARKGKFRALLRRRKEHEGLLVITDRMVLFMADAISTDSTMAHWGYRATVTAIERVREAGLRETAGGVTLRILACAEKRSDEISIVFPQSHARALIEVASLLKRFARPRRLLPRRVYEDTPAWEPSEVRRGRRALQGSPLGERPEREKAIIEGVGEDRSMRLEQDILALKRGDGSWQTVSVAAVSSFQLLRALTGCAFTLRVMENGRPAEWAVRFEYPQSRDFVRLASRLRHLLAQPAPFLGRPTRA